jgi:uncharacterized protein (TIRG00374 family)
VRPRLWLGLAVTAVLLWVAFRGVDTRDVMRQLGGVRTAWLVPLLASVVLRFWLVALRWQLLLDPVKRVHVHRLFGITMIGFMANNVLPARLGEFVRAYALGRSEALPASVPFATIVVERLFDGFALLLFLVGGFLFLRPAPWLVWSAVATCALYVGVLAALCLLRAGWGTARLEGTLDRLPARLAEPARRLAGSFRVGLQILGNAPALGLSAGLSLVIWGVNAAGLQATFAAFSLDLPLHAGFLVLAVIAVALVLPSAPGYVGPLQVGAVHGLGLYGLPADTALSVSIVYHVVTYVPVTLAGLLYLGAFNLTLGELRAAGEKGT